MFDQMVTSRKPIAVLAQALLHWTVLKHRVVDACVMPFQISWTRKSLAAVSARKWFDGSAKAC